VIDQIVDLVIAVDERIAVLRLGRFVTEEGENRVYVRNLPYHLLRLDINGLRLQLRYRL
jgi:hypothetical protein